MLPNTLAVDIHFRADCLGDVDPLAFCEVQQHDQDVGDLPFHIGIIRVDHFGDFPVELEEHRIVGAVGEGRVGPFFHISGEQVNIHD